MCIIQKVSMVHAYSGTSGCDSYGIQEVAIEWELKLQVVNLYINNWESVTVSYTIISV